MLNRNQRRAAEKAAKKREVRIADFNKKTTIAKPQSLPIIEVSPALSSSPTGQSNVLISNKTSASKAPPVIESSGPKDTSETEDISSEAKKEHKTPTNIVRPDSKDYHSVVTAPTGAKLKLAQQKKNKDNRALIVPVERRGDKRRKSREMPDVVEEWHAQRQAKISGSSESNNGFDTSTGVSFVPSPEGDIPELISDFKFDQAPAIDLQPHSAPEQKIKRGRSLRRDSSPGAARLAPSPASAGPQNSYSSKRVKTTTAVTEPAIEVTAELVGDTIQETAQISHEQGLTIDPSSIQQLQPAITTVHELDGICPLETTESNNDQMTPTLDKAEVTSTLVISTTQEHDSTEFNAAMLPNFSVEPWTGIRHHPASAVWNTNKVVPVEPQAQDAIKDTYMDTLDVETDTPSPVEIMDRNDVPTPPEAATEFNAATLPHFSTGPSTGIRHHPASAVWENKEVVFVEPDNTPPKDKFEHNGFEDMDTSTPSPMETVNHGGVTAPADSATEFVATMLPNFCTDPATYIRHHPASVVFAAHNLIHENLIPALLTKGPEPDNTSALFNDIASNGDSADDDTPDVEASGGVLALDLDAHIPNEVTEEPETSRSQDTPVIIISPSTELTASGEVPRFDIELSSDQGSPLDSKETDNKAESSGSDKADDDTTHPSTLQTASPPHKAMLTIVTSNELDWEADDVVRFAIHSEMQTTHGISKTKSPKDTYQVTPNHSTTSVVKVDSVPVETHVTVDWAYELAHTILGTQSLFKFLEILEDDIDDEGNVCLVHVVTAWLQLNANEQELLQQPLRGWGTPETVLKNPLVAVTVKVGMISLQEFMEALDMNEKTAATTDVSVYEAFKEVVAKEAGMQKTASKGAMGRLQRHLARL